MQRSGATRALTAILLPLCLVGCKPKLRMSTVQERITADAHKAGRLPREALHCQVFQGGSFSVEVKEIGDNYTGVVHIRADGAKRCDEDFAFRMERDENPPGGGSSRRYTDGDIAYWNLVELRPLGK